MTNYAIRKQKFCLKRDKSLRMGFCREDPPIDDVFVSYKLEKKKTTTKKENKNKPNLAPEIKEEAAATSLPGFSPTRPAERERTDSRENLGTRLKPRKMYFFSIHHFGRASY